MALTKGKEYFKKIYKVLDQVQQTQETKIEQAAKWIAESFIENKVLHFFGSGHSHAISEDLFCRAGGFAPVNAILDVNLTMHGGGSPTRGTTLERLEGYAAIILLNYDLRPDEIIIIISNSGINALPIEIAMLAKEKGLKVVALTNLKQSKNATSRHSNGKKLFEIADLVIDSCVESGDASIEIGEGISKVSPQSTVVSCAILQAMMAEVAAIMYRKGITPPVATSANVPGGDEAMDKFRAKFGGKRYLNT